MPRAEHRSGGTRRALRQVLIGGMLLFGIGSSVRSFGHHSFAMYDQSKRVTLTGTVTEWQWTNPHSELFLRVESREGADNPAGAVWRLEGESPEVLRKNFELRRDSIRAGDKISVTINPLRDGSSGGRLLGVTLPDGSTHGNS